MQMWREEYHALYSVFLGAPLEIVGRKAIQHFCFFLAMEAVRFLKRSWKYLLHKCAGDLLETYVWSQTFMLTPSAGSLFSSGWASFCCVDLSLIHLFHHGSVQPSDSVPFQFPTSELLIVLSPLNCDKWLFLSLTHSSPVLFTGLPLTDPSSLNLVIMCPQKPSMNSQIRQVVFLWPLIVLGTSWFVIFSKLKGDSL